MIGNTKMKTGNNFRETSCTATLYLTEDATPTNSLYLINI